MEASLHSYADFKIAEFAKEGPQNGKSLPSLQPAVCNRLRYNFLEGRHRTMDKQHLRATKF